MSGVSCYIKKIKNYYKILYLKYEILSRKHSRHSIHCLMQIISVQFPPSPNE